MWLALLAHGAIAADVRVPDDVPTLADALATVDDGGYILITAPLDVAADLVLTRETHIAAIGAGSLVLRPVTAASTVVVDTEEPVTFDRVAFVGDGESLQRGMDLVRDADVVLRDVSFTGFRADDGGGAIRVGIGARLVAHGGSWTDNAARQGDPSGGAVYGTSADITLYDTAIGAGSAHRGGAVAVVGGTLGLYGVAIDGTEAEYSPTGSGNVYGGAVYTELAVTTLEDVSISACTSEMYGGGIAMIDGEVVVRDSVVESCEATSGGGAMLKFGVATLVRTALERNNAFSSGLSCASGSGSTGCGGAITADGTGYALQDVLLCGNTASVGGAVYHAGGTSFIGTSVLQHNGASSDGGAVFTLTSGLSIYNNTFVANETPVGDHGSAVYAFLDGPHGNNVYALHDGGVGVTYVGPLVPGGPNLWWSNDEHAIPGTDAIGVFQDPLFEAYSDNGICDDDLRPAAGSPMVPALGAYSQDSDLDGDGYGRADDDCAESDPAIHPGAAEVCDGVDNDCDGRVDEVDPDLVDGVRGYRDADGDGVGITDLVRTTCGDPDDGFAAANGDCDDSNADVYPGAPEVDGDGVDSDCDGTDGAGVVDGEHCDCDLDGWGTDAASCDGCALVALDGDCDDLDPLIHPGAKEVCDGVDNDCDDAVDDADTDLVGGTPWFADADGDGYGDPATETASCAPDGAVVSNPSDCDDADPDVHPGAEERGLGGDDNCDGQAVTSWVGGACGGCAGGGAGSALAGVVAVALVARRRRSRWT